MVWSGTLKDAQDEIERLQERLDRCKSVKRQQAAEVERLRMRADKLMWPVYEEMVRRYEEMKVENERMLEEVSRHGVARAEAEAENIELDDRRRHLHGLLADANEHHAWHHGGIGGLHVSDSDWRSMELELEHLREADDDARRAHVQLDAALAEVERLREENEALRKNVLSYAQRTSNNAYEVERLRAEKENVLIQYEDVKQQWARAEAEVERLREELADLRGDGFPEEE